MNVYPEIASRVDNAFSPKGWRVEPGTARRGGARCNFSERILTVPLDDSAASRVVRAHELVHFRISPASHEEGRLPFDVDLRAMECAEEFRTNAVVARLGFDVSALVDGSERRSGEMLAEAGDWAEAVRFLFAVLGTGGEKPYLLGIKAHRSEWLAPLRDLAKQAKAMVARVSLGSLGDTSRDAEGQQLGYSRVTIPIARMITGAAQASAPSTADEVRRFRRSLQAGGRRPATGHFAPLVIAESSPSSATSSKVGLVRWQPRPSGRYLRYPQRLLTDPQQRGFGHKRRAQGGVVLIDQSGSMDISVEQISSLLRRAPAALILGYSHRPGDVGVTPNAWVLADRRRVVESPPHGNVGNGVDGPALEWAISQRQKGEPLIWVTDGQVTDAHDHPCDSLSVRCALLVRRERIQLVRSLDQVGECLRGRRWPLGDFGRVGRKLLEMT